MGPILIAVNARQTIKEHVYQRHGLPIYPSFSDRFEVSFSSASIYVAATLTQTMCACIQIYIIYIQVVLEKCLHILVEEKNILKPLHTKNVC